MYKGSAGSGKSWFVTQKIVLRCVREPIRVLVCRRYGSTIRNTVFNGFKEVLKSWQLLKYVDIRETDFHIQFPNGSEIIFMGLDEETKLLSMSNISVVFIEEIYEVPEEIVEQLNLRMRGQAKNQSIIGCFNPINKSSWLYNFCVINPPDSFILSETTFLDNPFLSQEYIDAIKGLETRNPRKYWVYGLGNWGSDYEGLVFQNWKVEDFDPLTLASSGLEMRVGSDLGFIDPTTIECSLYDSKNNIIYVFDEFYATGQQLDQVAKVMEDMGLRKRHIFMDSAEPRSIQFFRNKGFNVSPSIKGKDSVKAGISFLQNNQIVVLPKCKKLIEELENFCYIKDKHTGLYTENMTHEYSHCIDGLRYAYSNIYSNNKLKSFDKKLLGL